MSEKTFIGRSEFFTEFNSSQNQYVYFIIGLDAAAIAYAIGKTDQRIFEWPLLPLGLAIIAWGISLYAGIQFQQLKKGGIMLEINALDMQEDISDKVKQEAKLEELMKEAKVNQGKMYKFYNLLNYLFFSGVLLFIGFSVWDMVICSCAK